MGSEVRCPFDDLDGLTAEIPARLLAVHFDINAKGVVEPYVLNNAFQPERVHIVRVLYHPNAVALVDEVHRHVDMQATGNVSVVLFLLDLDSVRKVAQQLVDSEPYCIGQRMTVHVESDMQVVIVSLSHFSVALMNQ